MASTQPLARMGALLDVPVQPVDSTFIHELKDLHVAREALLKNRMAARNKGQVLTLPILKRQNAQQLRLIKRRMEVIEREIMDRIMADTQLACRFEILGSDPRHLSHHSLHPDRRHARARRA